MARSVDPDAPEVLAALLEHASEFLLFVDRRAGVLAATGSGLARAGFSETGSGLGRHVAERIHPDDLLEVLAVIEQARAETGYRGAMRVRARGDDHEWRPVIAEVIGVADHPVLGTGAVVRSRVEPASTSPDDDRFSSLAATVPMGVLTGDVRGWVVFANDRARDILGLAGDQVLGERWRTVVHPDDLDDALDAGRLALERGSVQHATFRLRGSPGPPPGGAPPPSPDRAAPEAPRWVTLAVSPVGPAERRTGWVATLDDVSDRERRLAELAHRATHDALTGLPDRSLLEDRLSQVQARRTEESSPLSLLFVDLDGFKSTNDELGHHVGDEVLRTVGRRLAATVRPADTVARLGGDEFVVVLEDTSAPAADRLARRLQERLAAPVTVTTDAGALLVPLSASVGSATTEGSEDARALLVRADRAMYERKRRRR